MKPKDPPMKTYDGHGLTPKESAFIDEYIKTGNGMQSVIKAGYNSKSPHAYAYRLLQKDYIKNEIAYRMNLHKQASIAEAEEILQYFTSVMRGETKDQFGLDAPLSERTRAAQELAKRKIDIPNKLAGREEPTIKIKLVRE